MTENWEDNFDALLTWLDPDPEKAGQKYEEIRHALIKIFEWRGAFDAEELAAETIARVLKKVPKIVKDYEGDPALYFYGVAKRFGFEVVRSQQARVDEDLEKLGAHSIDERNDREPEHECLDQCLAQLPPADRELILSYYQHGEQNIGHRKELARKHRKKPNALRVKVHRIRERLETCMNKCLGKPE